MTKTHLFSRLTAFVTSAAVTFSIVAVIADHWAPSHDGQVLAQAKPAVVAVVKA